MILNWKLTLVDCPLRSRLCSTPPWRQPPPPGNLCKYQIRISYSRKTSQNMQHILTSTKSLADKRPNQPPNTFPQVTLNYEWSIEFDVSLCCFCPASFQKIQTDSKTYAPKKMLDNNLDIIWKAHWNSLSNKKTWLEFVSPDSCRRMRPYSSALCRLLPFSLFSLSYYWQPPDSFFTFLLLSNTWFFFFSLSYYCQALDSLVVANTCANCH